MEMLYVQRETHVQTIGGTVRMHTLVRRRERSEARSLRDKEREREPRRACLNHVRITTVVGEEDKAI
jgi:hypothetical protein